MCLSVSGTSGQPPKPPKQISDALVGDKPNKLLMKLQHYDGSDSLETFLLKFQHLAAYMKWNDRDHFHHLCASLEGPAGQVLWELGWRGGATVGRRALSRKAVSSIPGRGVAA